MSVARPVQMLPVLLGYSAGPTAASTGISWSSAEPRIAKVSSTGLVAGVGVGAQSRSRRRAVASELRQPLRSSSAPSTIGSSRCDRLNSHLSWATPLGYTPWKT
jgi:hypothetical protein